MPLVCVQENPLNIYMDSEMWRTDAAELPIPLVCVQENQYGEWNVEESETGEWVDFPGGDMFCNISIVILIALYILWDYS